MKCTRSLESIRQHTLLFRIASRGRWTYYSPCVSQIAERRRPPLRRRFCAHAFALLADGVCSHSNTSFWLSPAPSAAAQPTSASTRERDHQCHSEPDLDVPSRPLGSYGDGPSFSPRLAPMLRRCMSSCRIRLRGQPSSTRWTEALRPQVPRVQWPSLRQHASHSPRDRCSEHCLTVIPAQQINQ